MINKERRKLLGAALATSGVLALGGNVKVLAANGKPAGASVMNHTRPKLGKVRFGIIGVGMRGHELMRLLLAVEGAEVKALCDIHGPTLDASTKLVFEQTGVKPATYTGRDDAYKALVERKDIDAVLIATPWQWHVPMALDAMAAGKETFVEVPAALNVEDSWKLVEASEQHRVNCMMLENCCYGRSELMVLNMIRDGVLGEVGHAEGGYIHNLWDLLSTTLDVGEGTWRPQWYARRRANVYPTHGLGPIAQYFDINRGDRFDFLVSMSTFPQRQKQYSQAKLDPEAARKQLRQVLKDTNSSLIQTARGRTILLQHDIGSPRPYSRINLVQGDKGTFYGYPDRLALESEHGAEEWITDLQPYLDKYDSPLWRQLEATTQELGGGHGGMDLVMLWRIVYCLRNGVPLDQNVYDAAAWSVIFDLSEQSMRDRSRPQDFPDFTRGAWQTTPPLQIKL
jgi:predicted dehydrogenase